MKLVDKIFSGYNSLIRPVENLTTKVKVDVQLALIQIIDVVCMQHAPHSSVEYQRLGRLQTAICTFTYLLYSLNTVRNEMFIVRSKSDESFLLF